MIAYRHNQLVYVPITKHASTTYTELFQNRLGWQQVQTESIDWTKDHVFAHIVNPYERHLKGTIEALRKYHILDIVDDPRFVKLLTTAVFDLHSYPLSATFGIERMWAIDWLMLDHPKWPGNKITSCFLQQHGVDVSEDDIPRLNKSSGGEKELIDRIRTVRDELGNSGELTYFYENDVNIYDRVNEYTVFCEMNNWPWNQVSWLTNGKKNV
jgi:hypothetical protein